MFSFTTSAATPDIQAQKFSADNADMDKNISEWKMKKEVEWLEYLGPHQALIMEFYKSILLFSKPFVAIPILALYVYCLSLLAKSSWIYLAANAFMIFTAYEYVLRRFSLFFCTEAFVKWLHVDDALVAQRISRPLVDLVFMCKWIATIQCQALMYKSHLLHLRKHSPSLYAGVVVIGYVVLNLLLSVFSDTLIYFCVFIAPVLWPALYHYAVYERILRHFYPEAQAASRYSLPAMFQSLSSSMAGLYGRYQEYLRLPEEMLIATPKPSSAKSLSPKESISDFFPAQPAPAPVKVSPTLYWTAAMSVLGSFAGARVNGTERSKEKDDSGVDGRLDKEASATTSSFRSAPNGPSLRRRSAENLDTFVDEFGFEHVDT